MNPPSLLGTGVETRSPRGVVIRPHGRRRRHKMETCVHLPQDLGAFPGAHLEVAFARWFQEAVLTVSQPRDHLVGLSLWQSQRHPEKGEVKQ